MESVTNIGLLVPGRRAGHTAVRAGNFILIWGGYDEPVKLLRISNGAILQKCVPYSQRYLVLGLVGLVGLALWLVSGIALNKCCDIAQ